VPANLILLLEKLDVAAKILRKSQCQPMHGLKNLLNVQGQAGQQQQGGGCAGRFSRQLFMQLLQVSASRWALTLPTMLCMALRGIDKD